jgi:hypothetical protein
VQWLFRSMVYLPDALWHEVTHKLQNKIHIKALSYNDTRNYDELVWRPVRQSPKRGKMGVTSNILKTVLIQ